MKKEWTLEELLQDFGSSELIIDEFFSEFYTMLSSKVFYTSSASMMKIFHDKCYENIVNQIIISNGWKDICQYLKDESLFFSIQSIEFEEKIRQEIGVSPYFSIKVFDEEIIVRELTFFGQSLEMFPKRNYREILMLAPSDYYYLYFRIYYLKQLKKLLFESKSSQTEKMNFAGLFFNPASALRLKQTLKLKGFTNEKNLWIGRSGSPTELLALYCALLEHEKIRNVGATPGGRIFYEEFGKEVGKDIDERSLRNPPNKKDSEEFDRFVIELYGLD